MPLACDFAEELESWLRLTHTPGLGPVTLCQLLRAFGPPPQILAQTQASLSQVIPSKLALTLLEKPTELRQQQITQTLEWVRGDDNHILTLDNPLYPAALLTCADPPPLLYLKGQLKALSAPAVAIVGSRHASVQGLSNARAFAQHLVEQQFCVVSGLALGIDGAAHEGALAAHSAKPDQKTIAVVGTGLDIVYPAQHRALAHQIVAAGLIISEYPLGAKAIAHHFPRRNRLIAGLSKGVLVVEAALQSGSLITAKQAAEQGREVFAIPGSIHSPLAKGCHALIKQGAKLVESAQDILDELGAWSQPRRQFASVDEPPPAHHSSPASHEADPVTNLLEALAYEPASLDALALRTGLDAAGLNVALLQLEMAGQVERLPEGRYQRVFSG
ncbi:DNA-processing protein DprA [Parvibium lacunae]|uniref:DNA-protecting protein DprA n=1 Tax=Parvibium lacunae TaxID=1888893 RepID=A0A368L112_9BURK|nr:DNA-processing protein DprA [Parvibium lacunae]RCS56994.1 DNA-protecting protein DprA [Parvibium lacunae]